MRHQAIHFRHRGATGNPGGGTPGKTHGGETIKTHHLLRRLAPGRRHHLPQGHHAAAGIAHPQTEHVIELHARFGVGLQDDLLHVPAVGKVVDVERPHRRRQSAAHAGERESHGLGLLPVDLEVNALAGGQAVGIDIAHHLALGRQCQQLRLGGLQRGLPLVGPVLQEERETRRGAQFVDGGRQQAHHSTFLAVGHGGLCQLRLFGSRGTMTLVPLFEHGEGHGRIGAGAGEAEALHHQVGVERLARGHMGLELLDDGQGALAGGAGRQLDGSHEVALILVRQKGGGQLGGRNGQHGAEGGEGSHHASAASDQPGDPNAVACGDPLDAPVEGAEETALLMVTRADRTQQGGAERRRQGQGEEGGNQDRHRHRQGELLVDDPHGAAAERHGDEHRREHQGDADHRPGDLLHGPRCRLPGR